MQSERREHVKGLFAAAVKLPTQDRRAFLGEACGNDEPLRVIVESMLIRHVAARAGTETAQQGDIATKLERGALDQDPLVGSRIGDYRIKRLIGSGGMGTVYEAVQDKPRRVVAIKVMLRGIASSSAMRRLEFEAQILGRLRHRGIAQVYNAGMWDTGYGQVPYFAMEYVPNARSLTDYADRAHLSTRSRLDLFTKVCDALHHGHQKGIIHRDLKPSNILVDSSGEPKIIDFGVARSTDSDMAVTTLQTDVGQIIGTLQYMSPEECEADPNDIDIRSDVYSLGVVLYQLLCGQLPYDVSGVSILDAASVIREAPPSRPSTIDRMLRGDLETIALKSLEKDRRVRYQSAYDLGQDIGRYLRNEPILARPPSMRYQLRHFARRNRRRLVAIVAALAVLVAAVAIWFGALLNDYRNQARTAVQEKEQAIANVWAELPEEADRALKVYSYEIQAASDAFTHGELQLVAAHLEKAPRSLQGWEWLHLHAGAPTTVHTAADRVLCLALSPHGKQLALAEAGSNNVELLDVSDGIRPVGSYPHGGQVRTVAFSPDGMYLATGSDDKTMQVWDLAKGTPYLSDGQHTTAIVAIAFSGNGALVASASKHKVGLWRMSNRGLAKMLSNDIGPVCAIDLNQDGNRLAVGREDGTVQIWDWNSERPLGQKRRHTGAVSSLAFDSDGARIASGSEDGSIIVWNADNLSVQRTIPAHTGPVYSVAFSHDGSRLASGSEDATLRIWSVLTGVSMMSLRGHEDRVSCVAFDGDGRRLVSGSWDKTVRIRDTVRERPAPHR